MVNKNMTDIISIKTIYGTFGSIEDINSYLVKIGIRESEDSERAFYSQEDKLKGDINYVEIGYNIFLKRNILCVTGNVFSGKTYIINKLKNKGYLVFEEPLQEWGPLLDAIDKDANDTNVFKFYQSVIRFYNTIYIEILKSKAVNIVFERDMFEHIYIFLNTGKESRYNCSPQTLDFISLTNEYIINLFDKVDYKVMFLSTDYYTILERSKVRHQVGDEYSSQFISMYQKKYEEYLNIFKDNKLLITDETVNSDGTSFYMLKKLNNFILKKTEDTE